MATARKFLFERSFDVEEEEAAEPAPVAAEPEAVAPTFSEEEMNAAREQAFAEGREQGLAEAATGTERALLEALAAIDQRLAEVLHGIADGRAAATDEAVAVAVGIARKLFPALTAKGALAEVERTVVETMRVVLGEPQLAIYVHETVQPALAERIGTLSAQAAYRGQVEIKTDATLPPGDCRIEWTGGGAARDTAALWRAIDEVLERNLAGAAVAAAAPDGRDPGAAPDEAAATANTAESER